MSAARALVVDDEPALLENVRILLRREGFEVFTAASTAQGVQSLAAVRPDFVLSGAEVSGARGTEILAAVREFDPTTPVILMTAQESLASTLGAVDRGAVDCIQKPFSNDELLIACRRALACRQPKRENQQPGRAVSRRESDEVARPLGKSRAFADLVKLAETIAPTGATVLLTGESGTGKEVIARYIHARSKRANGPFLSVNCGALPENLLESELFGHVRGSFTGAVRDKRGLFVAAGAGTFFLDEVGEMTPATQVKVLRVLQEREVVPVGATEAVAADVRIIAATNRDLEEEIRRGTFRSDLYYRLNVITLHLPPLRERREDVPLLAEYFLERIARSRGGMRPRLEPEALAALRLYDWPGNVRQLENALERAAILSSDGVIPASGLPERVTQRNATPLVSDRLPPNPPLEIIERAYVLWVLQSEGGNRSRTAEVLGIDPSTLYRKLARYGFPR
jgi:DNA-binding NtrC family response regulator